MPALSSSAFRATSLRKGITSIVIIFYSMLFAVFRKGHCKLIISVGTLSRSNCLNLTDDIIKLLVANRPELSSSSSMV
jgi:hypothetical protein